MVATQNCISCGLLFRVGQVRYQSDEPAPKQEVIYHMVCQQCGTEHLLHWYASLEEEEGTDGSYTLVAKTGPRFRQATEQERKRWEQDTQQRQDFERQAGSLSLRQIRVFLLAGFLLSLPLRLLCFPLALLYYYLRLHVIGIYGRRRGHWDIPEFDEPWTEVEKRLGLYHLHDLRCGHCTKTHCLTNSPLEVCPNCKAEHIFVDIDAYDWILINGRKVSRDFRW